VPGDRKPGPAVDWYACPFKTQSIVAQRIVEAGLTSSHSAHPISRAPRPSSRSALVIAWLAGYVVGAGTAYEQAAGSVLTATTLLLVALLKNAELRSEHAIQSKLDALATGMLEAIRSEGGDADAMLERAIRIDEQV
jgi:hypothetical protein